MFLESENNLLLNRQIVIMNYLYEYYNYEFFANALCGRRYAINLLQFSLCKELRKTFQYRVPAQIFFTENNVIMNVSQKK